ncbi:MAG: hypothetical protein AB7S70_04530 [Hyphomicrobium sp.]|uniref:hypothetical protein n=1 Tax=Hyphomicrobium sp. TaxID=82 RepID=UPI003D11D4F1
MRPSEQLSHILRVVTRLLDHVPTGGMDLDTPQLADIAIDVGFLRVIKKYAESCGANASEEEQREALNRIETVVQRLSSPGAKPGGWMLKVAQGDDLMFLQPASPRKQ